MPRSILDSPTDPGGQHAGAMLPAAVGCAALWAAAAVLVATSSPRGLVVAVCAAGLLLTGYLLALIRRDRAARGSRAALDALTGLLGHRDYHERLAAELERGREVRRPVGVVALDLDDFRAINEAHGHPRGDEVLQAVGQALARVIRADDTAARVGGEEFALILPGGDADTAFAVAERARAAIAAIEVEGVEGVELSASAGVASFPDDAKDPETLSQRAAGALDWAKRGGKRRTRRFDPEHAPTLTNARQRTEIEALLAREQAITSAFQPIVNLASGRTVGYEALARFEEVPGRRSPDEWFAQAHGCGLGADLEAAAIRAAAEAPGRPPGCHLSINVSPSALSSSQVQAALGGDLEAVVIEITEHERVADEDSLQTAIADLRARGARIAIDDAGAGHAGLKQLMRMRPDIVKLDRALIRDIHTDPARMALVESFVRFARSVGTTVCAEGIESLDELAVLAELDVQWGQGYTLAPPAPPWIEVSAAAVELCRRSLAESLRTLPDEGHPIAASDLRLVQVSAQLAGARDRADLEAALDLVTAELGAASISVSAYHADASSLETLADNGRPTEQTVFPLEHYPLSARTLRDRKAAQVIVGDPDSDPGEVELLRALGYRALLMVPVVCRGESLAIIEAYRDEERAWSRAELNRARLIANQFASVLPTLMASPDGGDSAALKARAGRETRA